MKTKKCCVLWNFILIFTLFRRSQSIIEPNYGVKTHQNYSKVYVHNKPNSIEQYVVEKAVNTRKIYPVYNGHSNGPQKENLQQFIEENCVVNKVSNDEIRNGSKLPNRAIYKRKIEYQTFQVFEKCPKEATGQFVYSLSCNQFLNCWKGKGQPQNCAPGTLFNPRTLECDYPEKVECVTGPNINSVTTHESTKSSRQAYCPEGFTGLIPNYTDCSKFLNCNNGQWTSLDCPPGTLFDCDKNVCDHADQAACFDSGRKEYRQSHQVSNDRGQNRQEAGITGCNRNGGCQSNYRGSGQLSNSDSYGAAFQSGYRGSGSSMNTGGASQSNHYGFNANPSHGSASRGAHHDIQTDQSQSGVYQTHDGTYYQAQYGSVPQSSSKVSSQYDQTHQNANYQRICNIGDLKCYGSEPKCPNGFQGLTKHPYDCKKFLNCANGITYVQDCGPGTAFNPELLVCDWPHNVNCGTGGQTESTSATSNLDWIEQNNADAKKYGQNAGHGNVREEGNENHGGYDHNTNQGSWQSTPSPNQGSYNQNTNQGTWQNTAGPNQGGYNQNTNKGSWQSTPSPNQGGYNHNINQGSWQSTPSPNQGVYNQNTNQGTWQNTAGPNQGSHNHNTNKGSWQSTPNPHQGGYNQNTNKGSWQSTSSPNQRGYNQNTNQGTWQSTPNPIQGSYNHNTNQGSWQSTPSPNQGSYHHDINQGSWQSTPNPNQVGYNHNTNQNTWQDHTETYNDQNQQHFDTQYATQTQPTITRTTESHFDTDQSRIDHSNNGHVGLVDRRRPKPLSNSDQNQETFPDYPDVVDSNQHRRVHSSTPRSVSWPPAFPSTDTSADYVYEYDDGEPVTLEPENVVLVLQKKNNVCTRGDFHCSRYDCVLKTAVCDGARDCFNGKDEIGCQEHLNKFSLRKKSQLGVMHKRKFINVTHATCALLCRESVDFSCKSFNYGLKDRTCYLSDSNVGLTGALSESSNEDYYELKSSSVDCTDLYTCSNGKCIDKKIFCDGIDDCGNREDEKNCAPDDFQYKIKLDGSKQANEGRVQVEVFGVSGFICDDKFGIEEANVVCKELGYRSGAAEFKGNSHFGKDLSDSKVKYLMDDLECFGNETTLLDCNFPGWGIHDCKGQEIAGVVCKTPEEKCGAGYWKCDNGNECVPYAFVCDGLNDCADDSDELSKYCEVPTELRLSNGSSYNQGRLELKHHGVWGTVCDDDFNEDAAKVVCRHLGFKGNSHVRKDAYFGEGSGPIWLDQVSCFGNESVLERCTHWKWGEHNCEHSEDVGIVCSDTIAEVEVQRNSKPADVRGYAPPNVGCGFRKDNQFSANDLIHARVISGGRAKRGDYPWQASLRVKGKAVAAHWCGAIVISSKWVLTAAHCLQGYPKDSYVVVAGDYDTDEEEDTEQEKYIDAYFVQERFRKDHAMNNDIALVKVKGLGFDLNQDVQPICLPDGDADYEKIGLNCSISGFGSEKRGAGYSHQLNAAWVPIINKAICTMPHVYGDHITDAMFCAGFLDGSVDACDGDSGGPLACLDNGLFTLYGITSWGHHCGYANKPGVYVKVSHFRDWIDNTIKLHG